MAKEPSIVIKQKQCAGEIRALAKQMANKLEWAEALNLTVNFNITHIPGSSPIKYEETVKISIKPAEL